MERTLSLCGGLFALIGGLFVALGLGIALGTREWGLLLISLLGAVFLGLGLGFLVVVRRAKRRRRRLLETGQRIWAQMVGIDYDTRFKVNGRCPRVIFCQAVEPGTGRVYTFQSEGLWYDPEPFLRGREQLPVFVEPGNYRHYAVALDGILPEAGN